MEKTIIFYFKEIMSSTNKRSSASMSTPNMKARVADLEAWPTPGIVSPPKRDGSGEPVRKKLNFDDASGLSQKSGQLRIVGFVHSVSPRSFSTRTKSYFWLANVETEKGHLRKCVGYSKDKRNLMRQFAKRGEMIEMNNVVEKFDNQNVAENSLGLRSARILPLPKPWPFSKTNELIRIAKLEEVHEFQFAEKVHVNIRARVQANITGRVERTFNGRTLVSQEFVVVDATAGIRLVLWGDVIEDVAVGATYIFTELSVKQYGDIFHLSSSPRCCVSETPDLEQYASVETGSFVQKNDNLNEITCSILGVECTKSVHCRRCNRRLDFNDAIGNKIRCTSAQCNLKQLVSSCVENTSASIDVEYSENDRVIQGTFMMYKDILDTIPQIQDTDKSSNAIEDALLDSGGKILLKYDVFSRKVISVTIIEDESSSELALTPPNTAENQEENPDGSSLNDDEKTFHNDDDEDRILADAT